MNAPEDQNGLREALARAVEAGASNGRTTTEIVDDLFVAGSPLASLIAERDALRAACVAAQKSIRRFPGSAHDRAMAKIDKALGRFPSDYTDPDEARARAAEAEITRLKEGVEALGAALKATTISLAAAISLIEHGGRIGAASDTACRAMLSDYCKARDAGRSVLATLSPKEHPHG